MSLDSAYRIGLTACALLGTFFCASVARAQSLDLEDANTMQVIAAVSVLLALGCLLLILRGRVKRVAELQTLQERADRAEARLNDETDELDKLRAEQRLLRDKIDALGRERDSYRLLCNQAPIAAWRRESSGDIIWRNRMLARILGPDADSDELASLTDKEKPLRLIEQARTEGAEAVEERRFVVDGQRRTYNVVETPPLADGTSAGFAIDISAVDEVRRQLRRHIEANNGIFEHIHTGVAVYDKERRLVFCNKAFKLLWGLDDPFVETAPTIGEVLDKLKEHRKLPEQVEFRQFRKSREALFNALLDPIEELYQRPDERMMRVTVARHGLGGLIFLFEDATDRIIMERNLNTYIAVQRATLDNLHEAVAVYGPDGRLSLSNALFREMWEISEDFTNSAPHARELIDRVLENWGHPPEMVKRRNNLIASTTDPGARSGRLDLPNGRTIDAQSQTLPDAQKLFTYLDVTANLQIERALRERNEALVAADLVKSEFLENMSYELRTPLNTILGFAEILDQEYFGELNVRQREYSVGIMEASEQFLSMINDMLDLASIQAGHMQVHREQVAVAELAEAVQQRFEVRAERRQVTLMTKAPAEVPMLEGDPRRIEQVLNNLLSNAIKFTPPGGTVTVGIEQQGEGINLWVEDTGIGIPEEEQHRIFEMFRTSERHTRRGTGLGLALVRNLVELHGGRVSLRSTVGEGTHINTYFPLVMPKDVEQKALGLDGAPLDIGEPIT